MDVVVTVPKNRWEEWLAEGDLPGGAYSGNVYDFYLSGPRPTIEPGERVYVVAHGRLRGYAPLVRVQRETQWDGGYANEYHLAGFSLVRHDGAVAVTIPEPIRGFRGWRYRWWRREDEVPFPDWKTP